MYIDDIYLMGPIPSDLQLHEKARSLGIKPPTVELYARYSKNANGSATSSSYRSDKIPQNFMRYDQTSSEEFIMKSKPISLPRIPVIKHSFQGSIPNVMRSDMTSTMLPECITALSPRTKSSSVDISKLESRLLPPPKPTSNSQATVPSARRVGPKRDQKTRGLRIIVSPNSKTDMKSRPGEYYGRRYPLVILDNEKEQSDNNQTDSKAKPNITTRHSLPAISSSSITTTTDSQSPSRARAEAIPVEHAIEMSASRIRPLNLNISGWFPELACKPKKLHSKSLDDSRRYLGATSTAAK